MWGELPSLISSEHIMMIMDNQSTVVKSIAPCSIVTVTQKVLGSRKYVALKVMHYALDLQDCQIPKHHNSIICKVEVIISHTLSVSINIQTTTYYRKTKAC